MLLTIKGKQYNLLLKKRIIPFGFVRIVREFNNEPSDLVNRVIGNQLSGRVALVTGGYKGIGLAITKRLIQDGARVIITGRNESGLEKTVNRFKTDNISFMVWDVSKKDECKENFELLKKTTGKVDILVNNAGVNNDGSGIRSFEEMNLDYLHFQHDINVLGMVEMCKLFADFYGSGTILNILSNTAVRGARDAYWCSKWAALSFTKAYSEELNLTKDNLTINGLCPGPTKTDMMFNEKSSLYWPGMANKRIGLPEEIAELAFVQIIAGLNGQNGEITICDGGESLI